MSPQKEQELSYFLDHWDSIDFDDKRKAADGLIISIIYGIPKGEEYANDI